MKNGLKAIQSNDGHIRIYQQRPQLQGDHCPQLQDDHCPQLNHIDIGYYYVFTLYLQCSKLRYANLGNTGIGDAVLKSLAHNCPGLQYLVVSGCLEMGIRAFLDTVLQVKLKHLDIRDWGY